MPRTPVQFAAQSYRARSGDVSLQRLQNLYLEHNPQGAAKSPITLYGTAGLLFLTSLGDGPIRGCHKMGQTLWVVSGSELYCLSSTMVAVLVGSIGGSGSVQMTTNGTHVAIATSAGLYAANLDGVTELPESGMCGATYQDGYGIFARRNTQEFWITALDNMLSIPGLNFSTADALEDLMVGCESFNREVWLFKERTIETWYNSGNASFPFARTSPGVIERGCSCAGSIAKDNVSIFWLGDDGKVYRASGYQPQAISTTAIELLIKGSCDPTTAQAFVFRDGSHTCYQLSFTDLSITYDTSTGLWHERNSYGLGRWRPSCCATIWGKTILGDCQNGNIYQLDEETYTDNGGVIQRIAVTPPLTAGGQFISMADFVIDMETGFDGQAFLDWTNNGGRTWSNKHLLSLGATGHYGVEVKCTRLGRFHTRSLRLTISDPVRVVINGAGATMGVQS